MSSVLEGGVIVSLLLVVVLMSLLGSVQVSGADTT